MGQHFPAPSLRDFASDFFVRYYLQQQQLLGLDYVLFTCTFNPSRFPA